MDATRFDDALRHFAASRRPVLGLGLATLFTVAGLAPGEARKKHKKHKKPNGGQGSQPECGQDADCSTGLRCASGTCLCDAQSNPTGCCSADGRTAFPGTTDSACGIEGNICQPCQANFFCIPGSGVCI